MHVAGQLLKVGLRQGSTECGRAPEGEPGVAPGSRGPGKFFAPPIGWPPCANWSTTEGPRFVMVVPSLYLFGVPLARDFLKQTS